MKWKMIRHQDVSDQFCWPLFVQLLQFCKERIAAVSLSKHWKAIDAVTGYKMKCTWKIEILTICEPCEVMLLWL